MGINLLDDLPKSVRNYISSVHTELMGAPFDQLMPDYAPISDLITEMAKVDGMDVTFKVVYSGVYRTDLVKSSNSFFIIHNQYLGQVLNMLNRIILYDYQTYPSLIYFHKVCGQIKSRYGFYEESYFLGHFYQSHRDEIPKETERFYHRDYTRIQERFLIFHEYFHAKFSAGKDAGYAEAQEIFRGWAIDRIMTLEMKMEYREKNFIASYGDKRHHAFTEAEEQDSIREYETIKNYEIEGNNLLREIVDSKKMTEEFICDFRSIFLTLIMFKDYMPIELVGHSIMLSFMHMRSLASAEELIFNESGKSFMDRNLSDSMESDYLGSKLIHFLTHRMQFAKSSLLSLLPDIDNSFDAAVWEEVYNDTMYKHSDVILEPLKKLTISSLFLPQHKEHSKDLIDYFNVVVDKNPILRRKVTAHINR